MRFGTLAALLGALGAVACSLGGDTRAEVPPPKSGPLILGVSTHFAQGWPDSYWPLLDAAPSPIVRDGISWKQVEVVPGQYDFNDGNSGFMTRICSGGRRAMLVLAPRHPDYDAGQTVYTAQGRAAFAQYVAALANRFGDCLAAVQIGNEINGRDNLTGPAADNRAVFYTDILRAVYGAVKVNHPKLQILGGSTNAIATGFLADLFKAGALDYLDGVVVHPYRKDPANVDWEIGRVREAMAASGTIKPIWANEFSLEDINAEAAPPYLAKMVTLMSAAGVEHAFWYALVDQPGFPNLGLFDNKRQAKPAATAYAYLQRELLPRGQATRELTGESDVFMYRFGPDRRIVWGGRRSFSVGGNVEYKSVTGMPIVKPAAISDTPFIVEGSGPVSLGPQNVIADSLYDYGRAPWAYIGQRGAEAERALAPVDWRFTTFIGHPALKPTAVNQLGLVVGGTRKRPVQLTIRYTATAARQAFASACLRDDDDKRALAFNLVQNGRILDQRMTGGDVSIITPVRLAVGDHIDFIFAPSAGERPAPIRYRLRITTTAQDAATCSI